MTTVDQRSKTTLIGNEYLGKWMADHEEEIAELKKQTRRFGEWKDEVRDMLNRIKALDNTIEKKVDEFIEAANLQLQTMLKGINQAEHRINLSWNTTNTVIEYLKDEAVLSAVKVLTIGETFDAGPVIAAFTKKFTDAGARLFANAMNHRKAEFARMQTEQAAGQEVKPMAAGVPTVGEQVMSAIDGILESAMKVLTGEPKEG